jgi:hypothetical protein
MALGTPTTGAIAGSSAGGTSVSPAYPAGIQADDVLVLIIGQKPSTANGGTVTTPSGWTLRDSLTGAGGYGTTLGADTGNTNLFIYTKDTVTGSETGNLAVTIGTNNVSWAFMILVPVGNGTVSYGSAEGQRTTAPTAGTPFTIALANGASATAFTANDLALWAMCIPTDVTTPSQFTAQSVTATGATFGTAVELNEPDSTLGNDIGGYSAYAFCIAGSSSTAPSVTVTADGTVTNVRGPVVLLRVRETPPPSQSLTQNARFNNTNTFYSATVSATRNLSPALYTNTNTFYSATVVPGARNLTPARYTNTNTFYSATITQTGGTQTLVPARYDNANTFYSATVLRGAITLTPARYDNANTFYGAAVTATKTLTPALYTNTNVFYSPAVTQGATLLPARYDNPNVFYSATVTPGAVALAPARYDNSNTFYSATITRGTITLTPARYDNVNTFYSATVTQAGGGQILLPSLYANANTFYTTTAAATYNLQFEDYVDPGYVDPGYIGLALQNVNQFFGAVVGSMRQGNMFSMFFP